MGQHDLSALSGEQIEIMNATPCIGCYPKVPGIRTQRLPCYDRFFYYFECANLPGIIISPLGTPFKDGNNLQRG